MAKTNYQTLTQYNSPNYTPYSQVPAVFGMSREIIGVVYHWWGDPNLQPLFINIILWLCRANGNSSAHLVGESGRVAWIIDAIHAAWHAANARGNALYVAYECNPRLSDGDYQTMGEFHYDMEKAYGKTLEIRVHFEFTPTQCSPIDKNRIRRIADSLHYQDKAPAPPASKPVPAAEVLPKRIKFKAKLNKVEVWDLTSNPNYKSTKTLNRGDEFIAYAKITFNNSTYYVTEYSYGQGWKHGVNSVDLDRVEEAAPTPEWLRNLKWNDGDKVNKLSVLLANGTQVLNLITMTNVNDKIIPKGTQIDIVGETKVGGKRYYMSSYAKTSGVPWGIPADALGTPVIEPPREKPEWLKNLQDIADQDFWTRSDTPILNVEDGSTARVVPINTPVRVTHVTEILGNKYMVLEGEKELIETIYLSDSEISQPDDDLEKRVSKLEEIIQVIVDFLTNMFKNFKIGK